jgi:hypothetical protein
MKTFRSIRASCVACVAFAVLMLSACNPEQRLADNVRPALTGDLIAVRGENLVRGSNNLVLLIGENHASVKTQKQLAELITRLQEKKVLQGILIEGVAGPLDLSTVRQRFSSGSPDARYLEAYWRQQLDLGLIAGYEFVSLTRPQVDIVGVEDMGAKTRYAMLLSEQELREQAAMMAHGATLLEQTLEGIQRSSGSGVPLPARTEVAAARDAASEYSRAIQNLLSALAPTYPINEAYAQLQYKAAPAVQRLRLAKPSFSEYLAWGREGEQLVHRYNTMVARHNALPSAQAGQTLQDNSSLLTRQLPSIYEQPAVQSREQLASQLGALKGQIEQVEAKISSFESEHRADLQVMQETLPKLEEARSSVQQASTSLEPSYATVNAAQQRAYDSYFISANRLRDIAGDGGKATSQLHTFFRDESERIKKEVGSHSGDLAERDNAMAQNTSAYLKSRQNTVVLLIVGFAHVSGLEEKLSALNVSYISGKLAASEDPIEHWEELAWQRRIRAGYLVFARSGVQMKELPVLTNDAWQAEQAARLQTFQSFDVPDAANKASIRGLAWGSSLYENITGESTAMRVGKFPFDADADYGSYVLDRGPVPRKQGEYYELYDRKAAAEQVSKLSDDSTAFAYSFVTRSKTGVGKAYRVNTPAGEKSLREFGSVAPPGNPKRVVLFSEADDVMQGDVAVSPVWSTLRSGGGAGRSGPPKPPGEDPPAAAAASPGDAQGPKKATGAGGSGEPPKDDNNFGSDEPPIGRSWWTAFVAAGDRPNGPKLLRTINPERAKRHLGALDKQQPSRFGDVAFFEESDLSNLSEKIYFTPERGDHTQMVVLVGRNIPELRAAVEAAGEAQLLRGKQIALVMCGDSFGQTAELRESLLRNGALMVWTNDRQITYEAGQQLVGHIRAIAKAAAPEERRTIDDLVTRAVHQWRNESPNDADLSSFLQSSSYVLLDSWMRGAGETSDPLLERSIAGSRGRSNEPQPTEGG